MFQSESPTNFLTAEEAAEVDQALLTSRDKFSARVAIYSLRVLKQIAQDHQVAIADVSSDAILGWIERDEAVAQSEIQRLETDQGFKQFFSRLVLSSLKPLHQISAGAHTAIEDLTPTQVIQWFERDAKARLEQDRAE